MSNDPIDNERLLQTAEERAAEKSKLKQILDSSAGGLDKQSLREALEYYLNDYKGGVPQTNIDSRHADRLYKVRKIWFTELMFLIEIAIMDNLISKNLIEDYFTFKAEFNKKEFTERPTTLADIDKGDKLIKDILAEL